jgi:hypothetical protein
MKFGSSKMAVAFSSPSLDQPEDAAEEAREAEREYGPNPAREEIDPQPRFS